MNEVTLEEARCQLERSINWYVYIKSVYCHTSERVDDVELAFEDMLFAADRYNQAKAVAA